MKVAELKEALKHANDEDEVILVSQPGRRALAYEVDTADAFLDGRFYIVEGSQLGYVDADISKELGLGV